MYEDPIFTFFKIIEDGFTKYFFKYKNILFSDPELIHPIIVLIYEI